MLVTILVSVVVLEEIVLGKVVANISHIYSEPDDTVEEFKILSSTRKGTRKK